MNWLSKAREIKITLFSTGKSFDPRNQKRTDALKDIGSKEAETFDKKLRSIFKMEEK